MAGPTAIVILALLFVGSHLLVSASPVRPTLVRHLGEEAFRGLYSVAALAVFGPLVWLYLGHRHAGPLLWTLRSIPGTTAITHVGMLFASLLLVLAFADLPPSGFVPGEARARGVLRITRHPLSVALACFGLSHLLVNGWLTDVAFFGSFVVLGLLGSLHQDRRKCVEQGASYAAFCAQTSLVPFAAIARGRQRLAWGELSPVALALGAGFYLLWIFYAHERLFGVAPL
jgi:uncharacterized membrane protein